MTNWKTSKYTKTIGISEEKMDYITKNKIKKSKAGFLDIIINYYKEHGISKLNKRP